MSEKATFAAGCFWGVEAAFRQVPGVLDAVVGYAGGQLLDVFWENHDPTTKNRQGPDVGTQYRSVIFFHGPEQEKAALESKSRLEASGRYRRPVVTEIAPAPQFWRAEDYHQRYLEKRGLAHCKI